MFIGRTEEINKLNKIYNSGKFECAVVYGRRRVGKTTLIQEFSKGKKAIYFAAIESNMKNNLRNLSKRVLEVTAPGLPGSPSFDTLEEILDNIYDAAAKERIILAIDEYPYLASSDHSVSSILQAHIDQKFKQSQLMLILCGSSMSFMEEQVLGYKSPLYGRRTAQFKVLPFDYYTSAQFCPNYSNEDKALVYGFTGGIPQYLEQIDSSLDVRENIINGFLQPSGYFFEEPSNLLKQELREPQNYNAIITAIANGASRLNEIATAVGLDSGPCSNYIKSLISLGIVKKEKPFGEQEGKKAIYLITDLMFRFWYRFVPENMSTIATGFGAMVYDKTVAPYMNEYMGGVFEQICIQYMLHCNGTELMPFPFFEIGRWWGNNPAKKTQAEIDIVAAFQQEKKAMFCECKYRNEQMEQGVLKSLIENSELLKGYQQRHYFLFSKSGFVPSLLESLPDNATAVDLDAIYQ